MILEHFLLKGLERKRDGCLYGLDPEGTHGAGCGAREKMAGREARLEFRSNKLMNQLQLLGGGRILPVSQAWSATRLFRPSSYGAWCGDACKSTQSGLHP